MEPQLVSADNAVGRFVSVSVPVRLPNGPRSEDKAFHRVVSQDGQVIDCNSHSTPWTSLLWFGMEE